MYVWLGGFKIVKVCIETQGGEKVVYQGVTGDYKQCGPLSNKIYYSLLENDKIETFKGFGIFYDNPGTVEKSKLRSEAGCILEPGDEAKLAHVSGGFKTKNLPVKEYVIAEFPYRNKMSIVMSVIRVYPALNKFCKSKGLYEGGAVIEIYDMRNKRIFYRKEM